MKLEKQAPQRRRRRITLTEKVSTALREKITSGEFAAGEKMPKEKDLVSAFSVSRTVIREALALLSADGLVEIRHGVGTFVTRQDRAWVKRSFLSQESGRISTVLELFELRRGVEIEAAGLAAVRRSPAQDARIFEAHQRLMSALENEEPATDLDLALHRAIAEATNNPFFAEFLDFIADRAITQPSKLGYGGNEALRLHKTQRLQDEHREIVSAISRQDSEGARRAMRKHLLASEQRFRDISMKKP